MSFVPTPFSQEIELIFMCFLPSFYIQRGLCNYYTSSEDDENHANDVDGAAAAAADNGAVKSNPKTIANKKHENALKSPVIRSKSRQSEEDRKNERQHRQKSRDPTSR